MFEGLNGITGPDRVEAMIMQVSWVLDVNSCEKWGWLTEVTLVLLTRCLCHV